MNASGTHKATIEARIIRKDGTVENLGVIAEGPMTAAQAQAFKEKVEGNNSTS